MRWPVALLAFYVAIGLELGLRPALSVGVGGGGGAGPSFVLPLVVFVALFAPGTVALWCALGAGLVLDLVHAVGAAGGAGAVSVPGPEALAMCAGAGLVLWARQATIRGNPLTMIVMTVFAGLAGAVVHGGIFWVRSWYGEGLGWEWSQVGTRLLSALLSGGSAAALTVVLFPLMKLFRFDESHARRFVFVRGG